MPVKEESYCEGLRKCCCARAHKEAKYIDDIGSSDSEDEILNAQIELIKKNLSSTVSREPFTTWKAFFRKTLRDVRLTGEDVYFFKYTCWQNMHIGSGEALEDVDFILYRFIYAVVCMVLLIFYVNTVTSERNHTGIIYLEAWCFMMNTVYALVYLIHILRDKFRRYRPAAVRDAAVMDSDDPEDPEEETITPIQIRELKRVIADPVTPVYQLCWLMLNCFMSLYPALDIVLLSDIWEKPKVATVIVSTVFIIHGIFTLAVLGEILVSRIPVRIVHFVYVVLFTHIYAVFSIVITFADSPVYLTMDWKHNPGSSYARVLLLLLLAFGAHIFLYLCAFFREWLVFKIERARQILYCLKQAKHRRSLKRRARLDAILVRCTSREVFEYVSKHVSLFREVMSELDERDIYKSEIDEIRAKLLSHEDTNATKKQLEDEHALAAARLHQRIQRKLKKYTDIPDDDPEPVKFHSLMTDVMKSIKDKRKTEMDLKRKAAEEEAKAKAKLFKQRPLVPAGSSLSAYELFYGSMKKKPYLYIEKEDTDDVGMTYESYTKMMVPVSESDPNTFTGLSKGYVKKRRESNEEKEMKALEELIQASEAGSIPRPDQYATELAALKEANDNIRGKHLPLEYHYDKCRAWHYPEFIKSSNYQPVLTSSMKLAEALADKQEAQERSTIALKLKGHASILEQLKHQPAPPPPPTIAPEASSGPKSKRKKRKKKFLSLFDNNLDPPLVPPGTTVIVLPPVPSEYALPDTNVRRIKRAVNIRAPERKWYRIGSYQPRDAEKFGDIYLPGRGTLMDEYSQDVDTRILERIKAKQKEIGKLRDDEMKKRASGVVGGVSKVISPEFEKLRTFDWDLNVEFFRYVKVHQLARDMRLYQPTQYKPLSPTISFTTPASGKHIIPIIKESLTEQALKNVLCKAPGEGIIMNAEAEKDKPLPPTKRRVSAIKLEKKVIRTQARTEAHGPMLNSDYHPLHPLNELQQERFTTTFHFIGDKLPHSGGIYHLEPKDLEIYKNHPGIHMHHPVLHLENPEGPHHNLTETLKDHAENVARVKSDQPPQKKMEKTKFGEHPSGNRLHIIAFHPIIQYHTPIPIKVDRTPRSRRALNPEHRQEQRPSTQESVLESETSQP